MSVELGPKPEKRQSWINPWTWTAKRWLAVGLVGGLLFAVA